MTFGQYAPHFRAQAQRMRQHLERDIPIGRPVAMPAQRGKTDNSLESRFDLAYNAAHSLCLAALRWHGYRSANRYIASQALPHTLGLGPEVWRVETPRLRSA